MWLLCGLYQQVCTIFSPRSLKLCALSLHASTWYCMLLVCDCSSHTVNFISMVPIRGHIGWDQQTHVHGVPPMDMGLLVPPSLWSLWHTMDPGFASPTLSLVPLALHGPRVCWSHPLSGPSGTPWIQGLLVPPSLWSLWHTIDPGFAGWHSRRT